MPFILEQTEVMFVPETFAEIEALTQGPFVSKARLAQQIMSFPLLEVWLLLVQKLKCVLPCLSSFQEIQAEEEFLAT